MMDTPENLKEAVSRVRYQTLQDVTNDHEQRIRAIEEIITEFKFIKSLTLGGGLLSLMQLMSLMILIGIQVLKP